MRVNFVRRAGLEAEQTAVRRVEQLPVQADFGSSAQRIQQPAVARFGRHPVDGKLHDIGKPDIGVGFAEQHGTAPFFGKV